MTSRIIRSDLGINPIPMAHNFPFDQGQSEILLSDPHINSPIPALGESVLEPSGYKSTRYLDGSQVIYDGWHGYPSTQFQSANGDMYMVSNRYVDAYTGEEIIAPFLYGDGRWANTENDIIYCPFGTPGDGNSARTKLWRWDIKKNETTEIFDFTALMPPGFVTSLRIGPAVGRLTRDDRYCVLTADETIAGGITRTIRAWSFDLVTASIIATVTYDPAVTYIHWMKMTDDGNYIVVREESATTGTGIYCYDPDFTNRRQMFTYGGHGDTAIDANGREGYATVGGAGKYQGIPVFCRCDDLSVVTIGSQTLVTPSHYNNGYSGGLGILGLGHISGTACLEVPGKVLCSRYVGLADVGIYHSYLFWLDLEAGPEISPAGVDHAGATYAGVANASTLVAYHRTYGPEYQSQPRAAAGRFGDAVMFGCRWHNTLALPDIFVSRYVG